ncbi:MAG: adenosylmethionine--8-amino-7-oxononanoate transaminase [Planctomycetota bacterium]
MTERLTLADKAYIWHPFTQMAGWLADEQVIIDSAEGFCLIDTRGRRYIDGVSSLWCNVHGHCVKRIDDAVREQLGKVAHSTLLGLGQTKSIILAEKLVEIAPRGLRKVFYSDSGATSVEIAIKMAYQYYRNKGVKGREKFIALGESYHGDTIGSASVGGIELFHSIFRPLLFEAFFVPSPHPYRFEGSAEQCARYSLEKMEEILREHGSEIAGVVIEPLTQAAAGMIVHPQGFLRQVRELTTKYDVLLVADEVATGFGRTGKMFACQKEAVVPDIMCLAKGITGGYLPLAATLTTQKIFDAFLGQISEHKTFYHGHTYTGNALGCAAAIASLELFAENKVLESLPVKIAMIKEYFEKIRELAFVGDVRQCGMMGGIEIVRGKATKEPFAREHAVGTKVCKVMRSKGAMMRPLGDVIVLMPPIAIDPDLLRRLLDIVYDTLENDLERIIQGLGFSLVSF